MAQQHPLYRHYRPLSDLASETALNDRAGQAASSRQEEQQQERIQEERPTVVQLAARVSKVLMQMGAASIEGIRSLDLQVFAAQPNIARKSVLQVAAVKSLIDQFESISLDGDIIKLSRREAAQSSQIQHPIPAALKFCPFEPFLPTHDFSKNYFPPRHPNLSGNHSGVIAAIRRTEWEISQRQLAKWINHRLGLSVDEQRLSLWENGKQTPSATILELLYNTTKRPDDVPIPKETWADEDYRIQTSPSPFYEKYLFSYSAEKYLKAMGIVSVKQLAEFNPVQWADKPPSRDTATEIYNFLARLDLPDFSGTSPIRDIAVYFAVKRPAGMSIPVYRFAQSMPLDVFDFPDKISNDLNELGLKKVMDLASITTDDLSARQLDPWSLQAVQTFARMCGVSLLTKAEKVKAAQILQRLEEQAAKRIAKRAERDARRAAKEENIAIKRQKSAKKREEALQIKLQMQHARQQRKQLKLQKQEEAQQRKILMEDIRRQNAAERAKKQEAALQIQLQKQQVRQQRKQLKLQKQQEAQQIRALREARRIAKSSPALDARSIYRLFGEKKQTRKDAIGEAWREPNPLKDTAIDTSSTLKPLIKQPRSKRTEDTFSPDLIDSPFDESVRTDRIEAGESPEIIPQTQTEPMPKTGKVPALEPLTKRRRSKRTEERFRPDLIYNLFEENARARRIEAGEAPETIPQPNKKPSVTVSRRKHLWNGFYYTVSDLAKLAGISPELIQERLDNNWKLRDIMGSATKKGAKRR